MENITWYPYIVYGEEWVRSAITFFCSYTTGIGDVGEDFKPRKSNAYAVTINHVDTLVKKDFMVDTIQTMKLEAKAKKYEGEADEIVFVFTKFDKDSQLNSVNYCYADGTILKIPYKLIIRDSDLISTEPSNTVFMRCPYAHPLAVTIEDFLK